MEFATYGEGGCAAWLIEAVRLYLALAKMIADAALVAESQVTDQGETRGRDPDIYDRGEYYTGQTPMKRSAEGATPPLPWAICRRRNSVLC